MFGSSNRNDASAQLAALQKSQAVIEFNLDGTIITANSNFLAAIGYSLTEVQGKHHRMFVDPAEADSAEYREFWAKLNRGEFQAAEFKRLAKGGREIWIEASLTRSWIAAASRRPSSSSTWTARSSAPTTIS